MLNLLFMVCVEVGNETQTDPLKTMPVLMSLGGCKVTLCMC